MYQIVFSSFALCVPALEAKSSVLTILRTFWVILKRTRDEEVVLTSLWIDHTRSTCGQFLCWHSALFPRTRCDVRWSSFMSWENVHINTKYTMRSIFMAHRLTSFVMIEVTWRGPLVLNWNCFILMTDSVCLYYCFRFSLMGSYTHCYIATF